ncbi:MAG: glycosyltransferase family 2 protein [Deltaproteobacteria bacterium]|nr:glycosyltransferase family 2 protein [Deltaproteobacteria bacterium]
MITGLTVLKNATRMGYPWVESILSVIDFVDHFHIGEGFSDDGTYEVISRLKAKFGPKLGVSRFEWPQMDTGFAIGAATNDALQYIRHLGGKVLYVQADELWHPDSISEMVKLSAEDYDGYKVPFLHLEHNCQVVQQGAGYDYAIRMVENKTEIMSHRDAWTFEGCSSLVTVMSLPHPLVHCNYCFWDNIPLKKREQADALYSDLGHYRAAADKAERMHTDQVPEQFSATESPFSEHLPPIFLPMLGKRKYYVREELLRCTRK